MMILSYLDVVVNPLWKGWWIGMLGMPLSMPKFAIHTKQWLVHRSPLPRTTVSKRTLMLSRCWKQLGSQRVRMTYSSFSHAIKVGFAKIRFLKMLFLSQIPSNPDWGTLDAWRCFSSQMKSKSELKRFDIWTDVFSSQMKSRWEFLKLWF